MQISFPLGAKPFLITLLAGVAAFAFIRAGSSTAELDKGAETSKERVRQMLRDGLGRSLSLPGATARESEVRAAVASVNNFMSERSALELNVEVIDKLSA